MNSQSKSQQGCCKICGEKANNLNFGVLSCASCKAFFRRNASKESKLKCSFEGKCEVKLKTRSFCAACRLNKCLQLGMNKKLIMGEVEKQKRNELVILNRKKKMLPSEKFQTANNTSNTPSNKNQNFFKNSFLSSTELTSLSPPFSFSTPPSSSTSPPSSPVTSFYTQTHSPAYIPLSIIPPTTCNSDVIFQVVMTPDDPTPHDPIMMVNGEGSVVNHEEVADVSEVTHDVKKNSACHFVCHSHNETYTSSFSSSSSPSSNSSYSSSSLSTPSDVISPYSGVARKLSVQECGMIFELNQVYDLYFTIDLEPLTHISQSNLSLNHLVNQSSFTFLRIIKFAKRLKDFVQLSQDCQVRLLKGCWLHLLLLRAVFLFDVKKEVWTNPMGDIPTEVLRDVTGEELLHEEHVAYCRSLKKIIGDDSNLLAILLLVVLFSPCHLTHPEPVSNIQDKYLVLLKHYLEAKFTFTRSSDIFSRLLNKISELNELVGRHSSILLDVDPKQVEPIMLEMLGVATQ